MLGRPGHGKQQLISVGIDDFDHVGTPPGLFAGNRALDNFTAKRGETIDGQLHVQARLAFSRRILAKDDLASRAINLADPARAAAQSKLIDTASSDIKARVENG